MHESRSQGPSTILASQNQTMSNLIASQAGTTLTLHIARIKTLGNRNIHRYTLPKAQLTRYSPLPECRPLYPRSQRRRVQMLYPKLCRERYSRPWRGCVRVRIAPGDEEESLRCERDARVVDARDVGRRHSRVGDALAERQGGGIDGGSQGRMVGV